MPSGRSLSVDGHELTLATHVLGPHLLTSLLQPLLVADGDARVVFVSSGGMYPHKLRVDDPEYAVGEYRPAVAYARTKRMQVVLAELWASHLAGTGVSVHSMHPGWAATPGVSTSLPTFEKVMRPLLRTAAEGADTAVWLMHAPSGELGSGRFWHDRVARPTDLLPSTRSTEAQKQQLWDFCENSVR
jgi:NAD(P)-dependent dehydrogenase (short-subunit alcohol dehydrogenase family)